MSESNCPTCGSQLERVRYFPRQLVTADDMRVEQEYFRAKLRRHNRYLHGWGLVCGARVEAAPSAELPWQVRVCPGYAVAPQGDDILIDDCVLVDLRHLQCSPCQPAHPCPPERDDPVRERARDRVWLAVRYAECFSRPVRVHPADCGCDETQCEYSRIRDGFELKVLTELPQSHVNPRALYQAWCDEIRAGAATTRNRVSGIPAPPCPECEDDPWVVIATILLPSSPDNRISQFDIGTEDCVFLWSFTSTMNALACLFNLP